MANFKTHITVSSALGVGGGAVAYFALGMPLPTCLLSAGLCGVAGMMPDLDSGPGVPLRESMAFAAAVVPMMLLDHFHHVGMSNESIVLASAGLYLLIRFGFTELLKHYTVHRGMFHSIPAAIIFGELVYLASSGAPSVRVLEGGAVVLGYLSHLVLDELWSLEWKRGLLRTKSSFGTALKFFGHGWWGNASTFAKLALLTFLMTQQPGIAERLGYQPPAWAQPSPSANERGEDDTLQTLRSYLWR